MSDLETLLREAREHQAATPVAPPGPVRPPNIRPWAITAAIFVMISVAIHFFWPIPQKGVLPPCGPNVTTSCQKP